MIAKNYRQFPDALIAQRELELVFAVGETVSEDELVLMKAAFNAAGTWLKSYAMKVKAAAAKIPAWWAAMRRRAKALAKSVKEAIDPLF